MMNFPIGILGGTFDPIHLGHLHLATTIHKQCSLQKIYLIPCYQSPLRISPIAPAKDRLNMVELAAKNLPFLAVDSFEIKRATPSYTIKTLEYLCQKYSATPLALIIGIDAFNRFDEWLESQKILDLAHLVIANRPDHKQITNKKVIAILKAREIFNQQELQNKMAGLIYQVTINPLPISATEIRTLIKNRKDVSHLVTPEVKQYIDEHKLYLNEKTHNYSTNKKINS